MCVCGVKTFSEFRCCGPRRRENRAKDCIDVIRCPLVGAVTCTISSMCVYMYSQQNSVVKFIDEQKECKSYKSY